MSKDKLEDGEAAPQRSTNVSSGGYQRKNSRQNSRAPLNGAEAPGEFRAVFQGLEVGLRVGIVVLHVGPGVGFRDAQIGQQQSQRLGLHRGPPVGVQSQSTRVDSLLCAAFSDQRLGQGRVLPGGHHPAHHVAAEDVHDHVQVEIVGDYILDVEVSSI